MKKPDGMPRLSGLPQEILDSPDPLAAILERNRTDGDEDSQPGF